MSLLSAVFNIKLSRVKYDGQWTDKLIHLILGQKYGFEGI